MVYLEGGWDTGLRTRYACTGALSLTHPRPNYRYVGVHQLSLGPALRLPAVIFLPTQAQQTVIEKTQVDNKLHHKFDIILHSAHRKKGPTQVHQTVIEILKTYLSLVAATRYPANGVQINRHIKEEPEGQICGGPPSHTPQN